MKADEVRPRLDIYFLPGATEMGCLVHYQREQITQGSYRDQIDAFEDYTSRLSSKFHLAPQPPPPGRLPGMSTSYCLEYEHYQGALFICTERDWRDGEQSLQCVQFNSPDLPKGYLWHEINISDMEDQDTEVPTTQNVKNTQEAPMTQNNVFNKSELNILSFTRNSWPINEQSPAFDAERMSYTVGGRMEEAYRWTGLGEAQDVWKKASKLGWLNWC
ncbi:hypothetical protein BJX68DRAFT_262893 [Aspergillus pseudodeflectus]|uniref:Uncharacterized protein n=1 Tax=Aspergillus pseudodeflectus TaxID=176178 RepID=A0ABR4L1I7_9EURO